MLQLLLFSLTLSATSQKLEGEPYTWTEEKLGVSITLPDKKWELSDRSQGVAKVLIFSPSKDIRTRCTVLYLPAALLPEGLLSREGQIKAASGDGYKRVAYKTDTLGGKEAQRLEYTMTGTTTLEYGLRRDDFYLVFQLSAPDAGWRDARTKAALERIRQSFTFTGKARLETTEADLSTAEEVRSRRKAASKKGPAAFEISHHDLQVEIDPLGHSLRTCDRITFRAVKEGLSEMKLRYSVVRIDGVQPQAEVDWEAKDEGKGTAVLSIRFRTPMKSGQERVLTVRTSSDDFQQTVDQSLIREIAMLGQVRERSSWSSHIIYYPIDPVNDAAMDIALTAPSEYTAVTGGRLVKTESYEGKTTFHYRSDVRRPRMLPFGFAAAKYIMLEGKSDLGLPIAFYGYPGEEKLIRQRLELAVQCAGLFEKMMGPLPFEAVRFAHVTPEEKEMGVSLPGLILISDGFFDDIENVDLSDGRPEGKIALSLLIVADELSHQWNFYSVPLPNELAEGVSTFTNALLIEQRHGEEAYGKMIRYCADAYLASTAVGRDTAVADPAVYQTPAYRGIAFCKVPVVLDMLRSEVGDEIFFAAWRKAFQEFDSDEDGYTILEKAFSESSGKDLSWFFEQWFFQAGCPEIVAKFSQQGDSLTITFRQQQKQKPYRLTGEVLIRGKQGKTLRRTVTLTDREAKLKFDVSFPVHEVLFDPDDHLLTKVSTS
jgi:aminopeptidase N